MGDARGRGWLGAAAAMFAVAWGANQFVSMLVAYKAQRGVSVAVNDALFGIYAVALIAVLLLGGPAADLWGRRWLVRPAVPASIVATVLLMLGDHSVGLLYAGRFVAGAASGAVFAAGTAWVKELSPEGAGARRAALALSLGFGVGPLVAGVVAQWAPHPLVLAYVPHLVIAVAALPMVWRTPETVTATGGPRYGARLRVPAAANPRFLSVVAPAAPWVFGSAALSFAVLPSLVGSHVGRYTLVYSAGVAGLTLATGVLIQPLGRRLAEGRVGVGVLGLAATVVGALLGALAVALGNPWVALGAAVPLGAGYGLCLVGGLVETQRIAAPQELAGLTAVYYSATYVGFALPLVLAALHPVASYPALFVAVAVVAALCAAVAVVGDRRTARRQPGVLRSESAAEVR